MAGSGPDERPGVDASTSETAAITRGFLFCDLRGYTAFVETQGDRAAADLLEAYRDAVRDAIGATGGGEIRTEGDSFYVVFTSASAAVRCGLAIVAAAATRSEADPSRRIDVGVGIHAGELVEGREGYVGSAVNIAARVCAQAAAGEVLVTDTVRSLVRTSLDFSFRSRGRPHLKGIAEPIEVFAVSPGSAAGTSRSSRPAGRLDPLLRNRAVLVAGGLLVLIAAAAPFAASMLQSARPTVSPEASTAASVGVVDIAALPGRIVFRSSQQVGGSPATGQVWLAKPDGTEPRQLTPLNENVQEFRPGQGYERIAYLTTNGGLGVASLDEPQSNRSWPGTWHLSDFYKGAPLVTHRLFAWLPSGELLIDQGQSESGVPSITAKLAANGQSVVPLGAGDCPADAARLASGEDLAASPNGQVMALRSGVDLWLVPPYGCAIQITRDVDASRPAWSPDGNRLAFSGQSGGGASDIWIVNVNGGGLRRLTDDPAADDDPTWSPDGAWIAWSRTDGPAQRLRVMRADGAGSVELPIGDPTARLDAPVWAPARDLAASPSPTTAVPNPFTVIGSYSADQLGLDDPIAMAIGPNGNVYVTDLHPSVTVVDAFGAHVTRWGAPGAGDGQFDFGGPDTNHASIAVGPDGRVYVSDSQNARVQVFGPTGRYIRQFGKPGTGDGEFIWPFDLSADAAGNVYVLDDEARNLQKFSPTGRFIWKVDRSNRPDMTGHGHDANIDSEGRIVVGNDDTGRVLYLDSNGREVDAFDGQACDVTVDSAGNTYVGGCGGDSIDVYDPAHHLIGRWAGPAMPLLGPPEFGPKGEVFALGKDGSLIKLQVTLPGRQP